MNESKKIRRRRVEVAGIVQGVGFRPFVYCLANELGLAGFVKNHSSGVSIEIEGTDGQIEQFVERLSCDAPPLAHINSVGAASIPPLGEVEFRIAESEAVADASTPISPDVATCDQCLAELHDPTDRRYRYPFINCTNCGPRYTIVRDIPYDRPLTTMSSFPMCPACESEYHDPANRRYHAQPNACPECGPTIWFVEGEQASLPTSFENVSGKVRQHAIEAFHASIEAGKIIATKGIGGFHLACNAVNDAAIRVLRDRKGRVDKPLAVMVPDIETARRFAIVGEDEERLLSSCQRPIVLLRKRSDCPLSKLVAPGNDFVGIMLPYSPLHTLLVDRQPLVMTSGNLGEEPIVRSNPEALERLYALADAFLLHNREIEVVCDDSVVRIVGGRELPIRRSRGYAPMPIRLNRSVPNVLAVGGELKATFCLTKAEYAYMSPHIGDMGNLETLAAFRRAVDHFLRLFRCEPAIVACDMHPNYLSSRWAEEQACSNGLKLVKVQHHHAHIASVLAEHNLDCDKQVIGVSFDGTGYGPDGAIWGGEVLIANCREYTRWAQLKYVPLPGGDASVKHPHRSALAHLWAAGLPWDDRLPCTVELTESQRSLLLQQLERDLNCVSTSSMGRLFDAVASLVGIRQSISYEAQAAMEMEALTADLATCDAYPFAITNDVPRIIDVAPMLAAIVKDVIDQVSPGSIVTRFHRTVVEIIVALCERARQEGKISEVALSGGVFQNVTLLSHSSARLRALGFEVFTHEIVPPNDGGLALGQAMIAAESGED